MGRPMGATPISPIVPEVGDMAVSVGLTWLITTTLKLEPATHPNNVFFNNSPNPGLFNQFGMSAITAYLPTLLSPTVAFHQALAKLIFRRLGVEPQQKRFPYRIMISEGYGEVSVNFSIRLFPPNILSIAIRVSDITFDGDYGDLIAYQDLRSHEAISFIARCIAGMVSSPDHKNFEPSNLLPSRPSTKLVDASWSRRGFSKSINQDLSKFIGILIHHPDYNAMSSTILDDIIEKNKAHNAEHTDKLLLIDKQGLLLLSPTDVELEAPKRLRRTEDLYQIALAIDNFLTQYPVQRLVNEDLADFYFHLIIPLLRNPDTLLNRSVSNRFRWKLIANELGFPDRLDAIDNSYLTAVEEKNLAFAAVANEWWRITDLPSLVSEEVYAAKGVQFRFLENADLKASIISDYAEAQRCLNGKNYKATIILCGSIIEALITAALENEPSVKMSTKRLYELDLSKLLSEAQTHQVLKDQPLAELMSPLRQWRNMIHPGAQIRKHLTAGRQEATIGIEVVDLLIRHLSAKYASS